MEIENKSIQDQSLKGRKVLGILAHVDAGKTTLSEAMLYHTGRIRSLGRVDHGDAYLDNFDLERQKGITIFSKQAKLTFPHWEIALLDTPGHTDFSPETERALSVLDAAILVIDAKDGVTGHTRTLWKLLARHQCPVFLFLNKMDLFDADEEELQSIRAKLMEELQTELSEQCIMFEPETASFQESIAMLNEDFLSKYLEGTPIRKDELRSPIDTRQLFPCYFGSALKQEGVDAFLQGLDELLLPTEYPEDFGAYIYKISADSDGKRLAWMKITGGKLTVKDEIPGYGKIDMIRSYSGKQFETVTQALPGELVAVAGPDSLHADLRIGSDQTTKTAQLQPVLSSAVFPKEDTDLHQLYQAFRILEDEEPMLQVSYDEEIGELTVGIMGEVQTELLQYLLKTRFGIEAEFAPASIIYRETIANTVEGVGHFEPLRHYSEVHFLLEPGESGSGIVIDSDCSTDQLGINWQKQILSYLSEQSFAGVLTGSILTDVKITLIAGRAHEKHTEGGDFRQACDRAVRQGLMQADNILLEPIYHYTLSLPADKLGRAMHDIEKMQGTMKLPEQSGASAILTGTIPASEVGNYPLEFAGYTGGKGTVEFEFAGYGPCHNAEQVISDSDYDPEADLKHPSSSVFCYHGAGVIIPWDQVREHMHVDTGWREGYEFSNGKWHPSANTHSEQGDLASEAEQVFRINELRRKKEAKVAPDYQQRERERFASENELDEIFKRTYGTGIRREFQPEQNDIRQNDAKDFVNGKDIKKSRRQNKTQSQGYLLVDGYNIIFAWEELAALAEENPDSARDVLAEILSDFQSVDGRELILVFDAYKVTGGERNIYKHHNITIVYTKEAETADAYIEKTVHALRKHDSVSVATSDALEQMIILGEGAARISARELKEMVNETREQLREMHLNQNQSRSLRRLLDDSDSELKARLEAIRLGEKED